MKRDANGRFVNSWNSETKQRVSLSLTNTAWDLLNQKAQRQGISRSELIEHFARALESNEASLAIKQIENDIPKQKKNITQEETLQEQVKTLQQQLAQERFARQQLESQLSFVSDVAEATPDCAINSNSVINKRDVTAQPVEQALQDSEPRLWAIFNKAAVGINQVALDNRFLLVNAAYCAITGYSEAELLQMTWQDITHPDDIDLDWLHSQKLLAGEVNDFSIEKRYIHKSGAIVWINLTSSVVFDANGQPKYTIGIVKDITHRKLIEVEHDRLLEREQLARLEIEQLLTNLQHTEKQQQFLLELNDAIRVIQDVQAVIEHIVCTTGKWFKANRCVYGKIVSAQKYLVVEPHHDFCNDLTSMVGKHDINLLGSAFLAELNQGKPVAIADVQTDPRVTRDRLAAFAAMQTRSVLCVPLIKGGHCIALLMLHYTEPHTWSQDEISLMEQIAENTRLTLERSQVEQALRENEAHLQLALKVGRMGTWDWDMTTQAITWSEGHFTILGLQPNECEPGYDVWANRVHPDDLAQTKAIMRRAIREKTEYHHEYRVRWPDGTIRWVEARGQFIYDFRQRPKRSIGAVIDITERKQAEQEREQLLIREQKARTQAERVQRQLKTIVETSPIGIALLNAEQRFIAINEALSEINGLSQEQHLGRSVAELFGQLQPGIVQLFNDLYTTGQPFVSPNFPVYAPGRSDRRPGYYNVYYLPTLTDTHTVESVLAYVVDVTDRFHLEQSQRFLAEASKVLSSSLDYQTTLASIAQLAVPHLADWCTVHTLDEMGNVQQLAVAHVNPQKVAWANELNHRYPYDPNAPRGLANVIRTGQSELYTDIPDALLVEVARDEDHLKLLREVGFSSVIIVPLQIHNHILGVISLIAAESGRRYNVNDLALAEDLGRRAALAVENARLYQAAQRDRLKAEAANRVKDEFLAVLSHELRSPLNPILGWSKLLRTRTYDATTRDRALEIIERNAKLQAQLIEDLLDVSRILRGKLILESAPVNLESTIQAAIETVRLAAEAKTIEVKFEVKANRDEPLSEKAHQNNADETSYDNSSTHYLPESPSAHSPIQVMGDTARLQQIVWNLLSNAVKFTSEGGQVQVTLEKVEPLVPTCAQITVTDTGKGISSEFLPYVFEYFRQEDGTTTRKFGGLGLGLAIVRHLTELHGGTVTADSQGDGKGATFIVRLPLLKKRCLQEVSTNHSTPTQHFINHVPLMGLRILVVDDETDTRDLVAFVLTQAGANVISAASAAEAFNILAIFSVDLLVCDIGMPEVDGYTLIRRLYQRLESQHHARLANVTVPPAIALTAYAGEANQQRAREAGFQMHLSKPIEPEKLVAAVIGLVKQP